MTKWPYPGARWWKFDFHTHTPASTDSAWYPLVGQPGELTPEQWLLKYMEAEIDCVAVTDHNTGAWIDKLKAAYTEMKSRMPDGFRELHLFPGVEISVNGGFHLLAILDPSATTSDIDTLLGRVDYDGTRGDGDGVTRKSPIDVVQAVLGVGGLPIPAHVEQGKGMLRLEPGGSSKAALDPNTLRQLFEKPDILAIEVCDRTIPKPRFYQDVGLKWTEIVGSDCHSFQGEKAPGSKFTWIKMARPAVEGLRLALLDGQEVSVRRSDEGDFSPFKKPEHFIEAIEISEARAMGRKAPAFLGFNPYLNALVGGRGTGKSTVMHAMRLAYRREGELEKDSDASETFNRFKQVPRNRTDKGGLLQGTSVSLTVSRDGVRHRLLWRQDGEGSAVQDWNGSDWTPSSVQSISKQRFPIRLFSQGQIASLAGDSQQSLLSVVDEAAGTAKTQEEFAEAKRAMLATRAKVREFDGKLRTREAIHVALQDVQRKLERFEATNHAEVLKTFQRTSRQTREIERQFETANSQADKLRKAANDLVSEDLPDGLFDSSTDMDALDAAVRLAETLAKVKADVIRATDLLATANEAIRANKLRRQLIIVTHNPNIVVNGDAEMIHALDFNHQCYVKESGSLQDKKMRDEICVIMEGGADAFERRYQRLGRKGY